MLAQLLASFASLFGRSKFIRFRGLVIRRVDFRRGEPTNRPLDGGNGGQIIVQRFTVMLRVGIAQPPEIRHAVAALATKIFANRCMVCQSERRELPALLRRSDDQRGTVAPVLGCGGELIGRRTAQPGPSYLEAILMGNFQIGELPARLAVLVRKFEHHDHLQRSQWAYAPENADNPVAAKMRSWDCYADAFFSALQAGRLCHLSLSGMQPTFIHRMINLRKLLPTDLSADEQATSDAFFDWLEHYKDEPVRAFAGPVQ